VSERIAVVGPREGADLEQIVRFLDKLFAYDPKTVLISGGARGVDTTAETRWLQLGGEVYSYRVREIKVEPFQEYAVEEWHLGVEHPTIRQVIEYPEFMDYVSALFARSMLVCEKVDRVIAFYGDNPWKHHRGTEFTVEIASNEANHIPTYIYRTGSDTPEVLCV